MVNLEEWEQRLKREVAEINHQGEQLAAKAATVRGCGEANGILVEVDASGDITNLKIAPGAMRWSSNQLTTALLDCHRKARADAETKINLTIRDADPRIQAQFDQSHNTETEPPPRRVPLSENEIEAADDMYFERRNLYGGWTDRP